MKEQTFAEKKRIAALDKKHREYDAAAEKLIEVLYERYPEHKTERIKDELYNAYIESGRDLDEIIDLILHADRWI